MFLAERRNGNKKIKIGKLIVHELYIITPILNQIFQNRKIKNGKSIVRNYRHHNGSDNKGRILNRIF